MKIAVLVYGRLRKCGEHYDNIINSIDKENKIDFYMSSDNSPQDELDDFIRLYSPVKYTNDKIEYTCDFSKYPSHESTNFHNMTCHFINKLRVFQLLEEYISQTDIEYDIIISLRVDTVFHNHFDFNYIQENTIYIPNGYDFGWPGINDQIAYGRLSTMEKYNKILLYVPIFLEEKRCISHPESLTYTNIIYHKLEINRVNLGHHIDK
jgi:hypothetical protein